LVHQDIEKPLLIDETFDGILCVGVLDFVNNITNMLQSFNKLLSPSGCLAITIPLTKNLDLNYVSEKDMHEMIAKVGFLILHQQEIFGYKDSETGEVTFYYGFLLQRSLT
jgi:2-polyprenyl-3-methyl-5-hydroxy-6-metoxy-1,4-benzoquinol methylase